MRRLPQVPDSLIINSASCEQQPVQSRHIFDVDEPRAADGPGSYEFVEVWDKGDPDRGQSFPSGHASTGFYFFALYFVMRNRSRRAAWLWLAFALAFGSLMGLARMIQGKHFLSDVAWSAGFVYLTAAGLYYAMFSVPRRFEARD